MPEGVMMPSSATGTCTSVWMRAMESATTFARSRDRAMSAESVKGRMTGASGCTGAFRAVPHETAQNAIQMPMIHLFPFIPVPGEILQI
jgi:hypothetical protein